MPQRDIKNSLVATLLFNAAISTDTNTDSSQLDMADYDSGVKINALASAWTDGSYAIQLHASDTDSFTPDSTTLLAGDELVPASGTITITAAAVAGADLDSLGLISAKRYLVVRIVSTSTSSGATLMITAEKKPEVRPEA